MKGYVGADAFVRPAERSDAREGLIATGIGGPRIGLIALRAQPRTNASGATRIDVENR
jgi:hypothetical protein